MGKDDPAEGAGSIVLDSGIGGDPVTAPQHECLPASLEEDRLLHFLASPTEFLVERPRSLEVSHTECDQTDPLLRGVHRTRP